MKSLGIKKIVYRKYKGGDEKNIIDLFNLVFGAQYDYSQWHWEYKNNYTVRTDIVLAFYGSKLIGQSAGMPMVFRCKDKIISMSRIQHAMIHPDFRRKGIFLEILKKLAGCLSKRKTDFMIAFPTRMPSMAAFMDKLGFQHLGGINTFGLPVEAVRNNSNSGLRFIFEENTQFTQADSDCINTQLRPFKIFNFRGIEYLNWRYHNNSGKKYCIVRVFDNRGQIGLAVCKPYFKEMSIDLVEFAFKDNELVIRSTLNAIRDYYQKNRMKLFCIWSMEHYPLHCSLLNIGFNKTGQATHLVYKSLSKKYPLNYDKIRSYYLSMGDSDVY